MFDPAKVAGCEVDLGVAGRDKQYRARAIGYQTAFPLRLLIFIA